MSDNERSDSESEIDFEIGEGDRESLASPTPPPKSINIHSAIAAAPEALLKEALELLWANVPEARGWIDFAHREQISETERGLQAKWPKKIAGTCNEEYHYDVEELKHGMCRYHDGERQVGEGSEVWAASDYLAGT